MDESQYLLFAVITAALACLAVCFVIRALSRVQNRIAQVVLIQLETWEVAFNLEADIAQLYSLYSGETMDWEIGGRLGEALRDANDRYESRKAILISEAASELSSLENRAVEIGQVGLVDRIIESYANQFPSLALVKGKDF